MAVANKGLFSRAVGFRKASEGVSAVEFALILPLMILMFTGAVEFSHALTVDRRVTAVASAAADLVAQAQEVTGPELTDIFTAAKEIMKPYPDSGIKIILTSVVADAQNKTKVDWSVAQNGTPYQKDASYTLPSGLTQAFSSVIVAEVTYTYTPPIGEYLAGGITMNEKFYLRPRRSLTVTKK